MRSHKRIGYLILVILIVSATITVVATIRSRNQGHKKKEVHVLRRHDGVNSSLTKQEIKESDIPIAEYNAPEPTDPDKRAKREAKGKKYNRRLKVVDPVLVKTTDIFHWESGFPSIPLSQSDAVVIGEVIDSEAYLSSDKSSIYSEFTIQINQVLKDDSRVSLTPGLSIVVEREGGRVRYPSGHISQLAVSGFGTPRIGCKYALFLSHDFLIPDHRHEQEFRIVTGYELRLGHVFPLDTSGVVNFKAHENEDETAFLNEVQDAIRNESPVLPDKGRAK